MATAVGLTPLQLTVSNEASPIGMDVLKDLGGRVKLVTWPEAKPVPLSISKLTDASDGDGQDVFAHVYFSPGEALADRWYALTVATLPKGLEWEPFSRSVVLGSGEHASRFSIGSDPRVSEVRCYDKAGNSFVEVIFSERVQGSLSLVAAVDASGVSCKPQPQGVVTVPADSNVSAGAPTDTSYTEVSLSCAGRLDKTKSFTLSIEPGLESTSGPALNGGAAVHVDVTADDWVDYGDTGRLYLIPADAG